MTSSVKRPLGVIIEGDCCHRKVPEEGQGRVCLACLLVERREDQLLQLGIPRHMPATKPNSDRLEHAKQKALQKSCCVHHNQLRPDREHAKQKALLLLRCVESSKRAAGRSQPCSANNKRQCHRKQGRPVGTVGMRTAAGCGRRRPRSPYRSKGRTPPWPSPS